MNEKEESWMDKALTPEEGKEDMGSFYCMVIGFSIVILIIILRVLL